MITRQSTADKAAANAINELFEGRKPDTEGINERYRSSVEALIEAFDEDGIAGVQAAFNALGTQHPDLIKIRAEFNPGKEVVEPGYATTDTGKRVFRMLSMDDIEELPDIEWLVSGILQHNTVSLWYGDSNTGKTFIELDLVLNIALGKPWIGRRTKQGRVLYIYAEGSLGLKPRLRAWKKHHNAGNTDQIGFIPRPVHLIADKQALCDTIESLPEKPAVVVIDTFSMCAPDTNENAANEVAKVLAVASHIKHTYGCHVMTVHHAGKNGDYRGSAAFKGNIDTMIELSRENETGPIKMHCKKQRDGSYFDDFYLRLQQVQIGFNEETLEKITSCVVVQAAPEEHAQKTSLPKRQQQLLNILELHESLTSTAWERHCSQVYAISENSFKHTLRALKEKKLIELEGEGPGAEYRKVL